MENFGHIEAVRLSLDWEIDKIREYPNQKVTTPKPQDPWLAAIVLETYKLSKFAEVCVNRAINIYQSQVEVERRTDGRMVNISNPVQLSRGIIDAIELLEQVEPVLGQVEGRIGEYQNEASFEAEDIYEELAKAGINFADKVVPRIQLFLHTYLWMLWTKEALRQANQFGGKLHRGNDFERISTSAFPYIAHPPLIVATIACTSMIEEVGAEYINSQVEGEPYPPDQTSAGPVLRDLEKHYPESQDFDIEAIKNQVIEARDNVSHYVTSRSEVVKIEDFEEFYNAIIEGIELVHAILADLVDRPLASFHDDLDRLPSAV